MTCPLYSVFHVVLNTQSLPACRETSHHTSLGAIALTAPRTLLGFTFGNELPPASESPPRRSPGHIAPRLPRRAARSQSISSRSGEDDRLIMPTGARSHALTTSAGSWRNISTVRRTNSVPNTSPSTLPTFAARSSTCPSGSLLDDALSGSCARKVAAKWSEPALPDTESFAYCLGFIRRRAQTHIGDILKIATSDQLNDGPHDDPETLA